MRMMAALAAALTLTSTAQAAPQAYGDVLAWFDALSPVFPQFAPLDDANPLPPGITDVGPFSITIDANDANFTRVEAGIFFGDIDQTPGETKVITFSGFDQPIIGFGASYTGALTGDLLTIEVDGVLFRISDLLETPGDGFVGFVDPDGITSLRFGTQNPSEFGETFTIPSIFLASAPAVPGPGALALFGLGVWMLARRR